MQKLYFKRVIIALFVILSFSSLSFAQVTDVPPAGFDVIVKKSGEIVHGKVVEVSLYLVRYKRTDIPDGPIYEIPKEDVFAISYRNQLTEYLEDFDPTKSETEKKEKVKKDLFPEIGNGYFHVGLGSIRNFSAVADINEYANQSSAPGFQVSYFFPFKSGLDLGVTAGYAKFKYADTQYSAYDDLQTFRTISESLFSLGIAAKYSIDLTLLKPYALGGLSYNTSNVRSTSQITFTNDNRVVVVEGGARAKKLGVLIRIGTEVKITRSLGAYADLGTGLTLVQLGAVVKLGK